MSYTANKFLQTVSICLFLNPQVQTELAELGTLFQEHLDLQFISLEIFEENFADIAPRYYSSIFDKLQEGPSQHNSSGIKDRIVVKYLLKLNTKEATLKAIEKIGSSLEVQQGIIKPWITLLWPESLRTKRDAELILESESFKSSMKGFSIASQFIIAFMKNTSSSNTVEKYFLYEAYTINGFQIIEDLDGQGVIEFNCTNCKGPALKRSNFYGLSLNVTGVEDPELNDDLHYDQMTNGELVINSDGFSSKILQILKQSLNFTVKAKKSDHWGNYFKENQSWYGAIKDVADGLADLGIASTTMRPNRAKVISFLPATDEQIISAFFRPADLNQIRDIFVRPFKPDLWAAVVSTWLVLAFFMILFSLIRKRYNLHVNQEDGTTEPDFIHDSFIWALATACQQGWDDHPVAGSLRTIFISGSFTGVVAYAGYSAAIVSTLSLKIDPIQTPSQLLDSSLRIGIREGFINELLQQNNTNDIMTRYQERLRMSKPNEQFLKVVDGYDHLQKEPFAFISTRDTVYDYLKVTRGSKEICALKELQILKHGFPIGHFIAKNSPYKEMIRYLYVSIREPGVSWKLRHNYTYNRRCLEASDNSGQKLGINDVFTAFMILSAGFACSLTFVLIEKLLSVGSTFPYIR